MKKVLSQLICKCGPAFLSLAVLITACGIQSCRGHFYQPKEPDGLKKILKNK